MTPLEQYPGARRIVYGILWVAGLFLTGVQLWVAATDAGQPQWLTGALAVLPAVCAYVGYQAQANTANWGKVEPVSDERLRSINLPADGVTRTVEVGPDGVRVVPGDQPTTGWVDEREGGDPS